MKKMGKYIGMIALLFVLCMAKSSQTAKAADTMTMTELYNSKDYDAVRTSGKTITVSSLTEFKMFQKAAAEDTKGLENLTFVQTKDIIASDYTFYLNEMNNKIGIKKDDELIGYIDNTYVIYGQYQWMSHLTFDDLGIRDALGYNFGNTAVNLKGSYDGRNHLLKGFIIGYAREEKANLGGLFANTNADIKNLHIKDCCALYNYTLVADAVNGGTLSNITIENCCSMGSDNSYIARKVSKGAVISQCVVKNSAFLNSSKVQEETDAWNTEDSEETVCIGGIASELFGGEIQDCFVQKFYAYSLETTDDAAGGIVGHIESSEGKVVNCIADCTLDHIANAGGIVGAVENADMVQILNCISSGTIEVYGDAQGIGGGLIGSAVGKNTIGITNSLSIMDIKSSLYSGGIIGKINSSVAMVQIQNCLFAGKVSAENKTGSIAAYFRKMSAGKCYAVRTAGKLFGEDNANATECYTVSNKQLLGNGTDEVITESGNYDYKGEYSVVELLNQYVFGFGESSLKAWTTLQNGLPVPQLNQNWLDAITYVPNDESKIANTEKTDDSNNGTNGNDQKNDTSSDQSGTGSNHSNSNAPLTTNTTNGTPNVSASPNPTWNNQLSSMQSTSSFVNRIKAEALSNKAVKFTWDKKSNFSKMILYYSTDGRKYKKITTCNSKKHTYTWKAGKPGKKYYFRFVTYQMQNGRLVNGKIVTKKLLLPTLKTPIYQLSIGKSGKQKYMQITMKKYQGRYVEISLKKGNAAFKKAPMVSNKIAYYHGKILFTYQKGGVVYSCKLRTYLIKNGRRKYSAYSKVKKIRI